MIAGLNARIVRHSKMVRHFFSGPQGEDLEALLNRNYDQTQMALDNSQRALESIQLDTERLNLCLQKFALERYDAFDDMKGEQSFSLALLDGQGNGTVITSLQSRQTSRCYGKAIENGQPQQALSDEEQKVLIQALQTKSSAPVIPLHIAGAKAVNAQAQPQLANAA